MPQFFICCIEYIMNSLKRNCINGFNFEENLKQHKAYKTHSISLKYKTKTKKKLLTLLDWILLDLCAYNMCVQSCVYILFCELALITQKVERFSIWAVFQFLLAHRFDWTATIGTYGMGSFVQPTPTHINQLTILWIEFRDINYWSVQRRVYVFALFCANTLYIWKFCFPFSILFFFPYNLKLCQNWISNIFTLSDQQKGSKLCIMCTTHNSCISVPTNIINTSHCKCIFLLISTKMEKETVKKNIESSAKNDAKFSNGWCSVFSRSHIFDASLKFVSCKCIIYYSLY